MMIDRYQGIGRIACRPTHRGVVAIRVVKVIAVPSNKSMELTIKSVTPFAYAKAAPLLLAAHARCYVTQAEVVL